MRKNRIKDILDLSRIVLLVLTVLIRSMPFSLILITLFVLLTIIDRIYWRCKKCGNFLPNKIWFHSVKCCPYCKTDIDNTKF